MNSVLSTSFPVSATDQVFFVVGPTASGKSELSAEVARRCGAEIVSADAFQIYRGLPLLTAQPDEGTLRKVPHHLIAAVPLTEEMSAEKFRELALTAMEKIHQRGKLAIVVGGSGLYLKALTHGLAPLPAVDPGLRAELNALSLDELYARLLAVDSLGAEKIDRRNKRRLVRALEIFVQTKMPASAQRKQWEQSSPHVRGAFVFRERAELNCRIDRRVEEMFRADVANEVARVGPLSTTAAKTLGIEQIRLLLAGKISSAECVATIQQATRRYAKRQLTWYRRQPNFEPLNLSLLKDHAAAVDWILQKVALLPPR
ncbi:MAG TPA: tRNA (adenosine(37)-N6)-dimethylallyltransferase MiaA [Chthoniobacterales bacterium]|nr:tRNA (adenosine(37)-N6)-dimethylallyltransferase MiaA [Chthoniobacterales bacterium]